MTIAACVDTRLGMTFGSRRQSRDKALCQRLLERAEGGILWIHPDSAGLFAPLPSNVKVAEDFLEQAGPNDLCFLEKLPDRWPRFNRLLLYDWNRHYPADVRFPNEILQGMRLAEQRDFAGNSHPVITEKVYEK